MREIRVWFDGGSRPLATGASGYGSYEVDGGEQLKHRGLRQEFGSPITCNQAEYLALLAALKWLSHHVTPAECSLKIMSDSKLVVNQIPDKRWRTKIHHLKVLRDEARSLLAGYAHFNLEWHGRSNNISRFGH